MLHFARTALLLAAINIIAAVAACHALRSGWQPARWDTFGSLFFIAKDQHHDLVFLGGSRAHSFTACESTSRIVEETIGEPITYITGYGNGPFPIRAYVDHFYARGNSADHFVYFIDTPLVYGNRYNEQIPRLAEEPFRLTFAYALIRDGMPPSRLIEYLRTKFQADWLTRTDPRSRCHERLPDKAMRQRPARTTRTNTVLYPNGVSVKRLDRSMTYLEDLLQTAQANDTRITLIILPTLLTNEPGKPLLLERLEALTEPPHITLHDYGNEMQSPKYFFDMHHMNETGATHFTKTFLAPLLN